MFDNFLSSLKSTASNDMATSRRRQPRREVDRCVAVIHGRTFPIENWSMGGVLIAADERLFGIGREMEFTIKFKLRNSLIDVPLRGEVVRKVRGKVALRFEPLGITIKRAFQQVVDDYAARQFANSQAD
jgi:hypothetical protein